MREEKTKYYVIKEKAVPEVLLKVIEAKRLMDMQELTVQQATEKAGISRSSFYKYKDDILPFHDNAKGKTILISSHILDELSRLATHYGFIDGGCMIKEISAQELESRCRKCIRASVSSTGALARVLDAMGAAYSIVDDSQADIYGEVQITALVEALGREGCTVYSVKEHDESLESFYMELVGGERHV